VNTFTKQKTITSISRVIGYVGNLSQSTTVSSVKSCYLRPLSEIESSTNGFQYGTSFNAIFEIADDIREGDKITIGGVVYLTQGVATHDRGFRTQYKKALITKPQT